MTDILFHSAPAVARHLSERLDGLLENLPADEGARLRRMLLVEEHERPGWFSPGSTAAASRP